MKSIKEIIASLSIPPQNSHKGENGRLLIIGGSKHYHGAPLFSILAARRFVDMLYVLPGDDDPFLKSTIKQIPEVIVIDEDIPDKVDCTLFGIGLGNKCMNIQFPAMRRVVIDGDGLKCIKNHIPKGAVLTPHEGEFAYLFGIKGTKENVKKMASKHKCVILKKGSEGDVISDGKQLWINTIHNQGMTKGGTGDVLSGLVAALATKNPSFEAACASAYINGYAGELLRKKVGFNFCASDLAETIAEAYYKIKKN